jgi:hypothetical protein
VNILGQYGTLASNLIVNRHASNIKIMPFVKVISYFKNT